MGLNMFRCRWFKGLLGRKIVSLVLFSYFVMIFLFLLNLEIIQSSSESGESTVGVSSDSLHIRENSMTDGRRLLRLFKQLTSANTKALQPVNNVTASLEIDLQLVIATENITHAGPDPLLRPMLDLKHEKAGDFIVIGEDAFVYSAFIDDRKIPSFVRILSLMSVKASRQPIYCHFNETAAAERCQATRYELCENHNAHFGGYVFSCPVPNLFDITTLDFVTISFGESRPNIVIPLLPVRPPAPKIVQLDLFPSMANASDKIHLEKNHTTSIQMNSDNSSKNLDNQTMSQKTLSFAICISPLFGNISEHRMVEFIELSRLLGAQHFIFYNHSMTPRVSHLLQYYIRKKLASVLQWTLPPQIHNDIRNTQVWYRGQLLAHNDCLYRAMSRFDLVAFNDIDEFIVPHSSAGNWRDVFSSMLSYDRCGFSLQSAYYDPGNRDPFTTDLLTPILTERTSIYSKVRRKVMLCPWRVFEVGIHHISKQNREEWLPLQVSPEVAYLHHYRNCQADYGMFCDSWVNDSIIADRYLNDLAINFNRVLTEISSFR